MRGTIPTTTRMGISEARANLTTVVNDVFAGETRVVVEKSGIPVAAFVSPADLARLDELDRRHHRLFELLDEMQAAFADVSEEELWEEANRSVAEAREEMAAEAQASGAVRVRRAESAATALVGANG